MNAREFFGSIKAALSQFGPPVLGVKVEPGGPNRIAVRDGYTIRHYDVRPPVRAHVIDTVDSLATYGNREAALVEGLKDQATVFVGKPGVALVFNDRETRGMRERLERASCETNEHHRLRRWLAAFEDTKGTAHADFRRHVEAYAGDVVDPQLLAAVTTVSLRHGVVLDSDADDGEVITLKIVDRQEKAKGVAQIPKRFSISVPVFDAMPDAQYEVIFALSVRLTKGERPRAVFDVRALNVADVREAAFRDLFEATKAAFGEGWTVVRGQPSESMPL